MLSFTFRYGSLWRRAAALLIDLLLLSVMGFVLLDPFLVHLGHQTVYAATLRIPISVDIMRGYSEWLIVMLIISWLYFAMMESSRKQGTIGKRLLGLMVFTSGEERVDFWHATTRFWIKLLTIGTGLFGFILAFWDSRSRTLHDRVAMTIVLQAQPEISSRYPDA